ncbi:EPIDERMAL PATTERNING FACTOR-like protein 3 isoform X2 [Vigna angularis]|nr:EPIDERMAL PATTERNING FACTOR-like protein 3 isoform X2 [Vigna angularis]XP_052726395.1 EPIDERMAL PATTERNING FACTOR-like protein 3 isoform X2 [Vigna angularis]
MSNPGPQEAPVPMSSPQNTVESEKGLMDKKVMSDSMEKTYNIGVRKIGSIPPSCDHKCYGCTPCEAIQVPSTSSRNNHLGLQYSNYEPESWKCKCGPSLYSP